MQIQTTTYKLQQIHNHTKMHPHLKIHQTKEKKLSFHGPSTNQHKLQQQIQEGRIEGQQTRSNPRWEDRDKVGEGTNMFL